MQRALGGRCRVDTGATRPLDWGRPAALKLKDREQWIGWNRALAAERLKLVVQNRRYLRSMSRQ